MHVLRGIGMQVVMPVLGGPPENALLPAALGQEGQDELENPAGPVSAVGEVAVISSPDREHAQPVQRDADRDSLPCNARPDRGNTCDMNDDEWNGGRIDNVVMHASG